MARSCSGGEDRKRMAGDPKETGRLGEELAARFLQERGWTVLERNLRSGRKEIDLVVERSGTLAFVEVKCRRGHGFGHPLEAITSLKREEIATVARAWLRSHRLPPGTVVRFDAVAVVLARGRDPDILHVEDAWRMG